MIVLVPGVFSQTFFDVLFMCRNADDVQEYQRVAAHCGKGLAELQKELTRIKVATHTQVTSLAITREVLFHHTQKIYISHAAMHSHYIILISCVIKRTPRKYIEIKYLFILLLSLSLSNS